MANITGRIPVVFITFADSKPNFTYKTGGTRIEISAAYSFTF